MTYQAAGKLLLTGEYFVLDGAEALAVPTQRGQRLISMQNIDEDTLQWRSLTQDGQCWFNASWRRTPTAIHLDTTNDPQTAARLAQIWSAIQAQNAQALDYLFGQSWEIRLEFPRDWGLGSSSTLISLLAQLTHTNAYQLLEASFGGSGYDLACAQASGAIIYQLQNEQPVVTNVEWSPTYKDQLYFIHLGRKQNSRDGIRLYRELGGTQVTLIDEVSALTRAFLEAGDLQTAAEVARTHEALIGTALQLPLVQSAYFKDFPGVVKSLGAWGGDFVLAFSEMAPTETLAYFHEKQYPVVMNWSEMVRDQ